MNAERGVTGSHRAAGSRAITVADDIQGVDLPVWVLYPTRDRPQRVPVGPYTLDAATDGTVAGPVGPLVVISHGGTATPLVHRGTAVHLARAGFMVALPEHIGDSRSDGSLHGTAANLVNRPRHVRLVIDAVCADERFGPPAASRGVGVIGHSIGACTALAVAGGRPHAGPHETSDGSVRPVPVVRDHRVRALALLAPAVAWYRADGALADVDVPMMLRTAEFDALAPSDEHRRTILRGVPDAGRVDHRVITGAGHFSFQTPFPPALTRPDFPPSQDPPGFDRAAYAPQLNHELTDFFSTHL